MRQLVAGRTVEEAVALLEEQLPPDVQPEITVGPFWVGKDTHLFLADHRAAAACLAAVRSLCIDLGQRRVGVAVSDPTGTIARPLIVLQRKERQPLLEAIAAIARREGAGRVIVGPAAFSLR